MSGLVLDINIPITYQDNPGRLSAVFYVTNRCNLRCYKCFNSGLPNKYMNSEKFNYKLDKLKELGVEWIVISGGEPTNHLFLTKLIYELKKREFYVRLDTNGTKPEFIEQLIGVVDGFAIDIKIPLTLPLTKDRMERYCKILYSSNCIHSSLVKDYIDKVITSIRYVRMCEYVKENSVFRTVKYPFLELEDIEAINQFVKVYNLNHIYLNFIDF